MTCRWVRDKSVPGGKFHLPGCMGAAVYGPGGCTCSEARRKKELEDRVDELERRLARLEKHRTPGLTQPTPDTAS